MRILRFDLEISGLDIEMVSVIHMGFRDRIFIQFDDRKVMKGKISFEIYENNF